MAQQQQPTTQDTVVLTADTLKDVIATAVAAAIQESRKPEPLTEAEKARIRDDNDQRLANAEAVLQQMETKRFEQLSCTHKHATGESHCVFILDGNYMLCQKCQGKIRPGSQPKEHSSSSDIFDTALFNRLFQEVQKTDM